MTEEQITAAARALSNDNADVCNVNREDNWNIYGDSFRETARVALEAALAVAPVVDAGARQTYAFLVPGDVIQSTDERYSAEYHKWKPIAPLYVGTTVEASTRPVRRALSASPAVDAGATFHRLLAALIDIYDDAMNNAPEDRCYVEGAWKECLDEARAALSTPPPAKLSTDSVDKAVHKLTDTDLEKLYWTAMDNAADILRFMDEARVLLAASDSQGGADAV